MLTPPPEIPDLTPSDLVTLPLNEDNCDRMAQGDIPAAYSEPICGRDGHGCMNHTCPLMPIQERLECLKVIREVEAQEQAEEVARTPALTFTSADHTLLDRQPFRTRKPSEWHALAEKYQALRLDLCASLCEEKRRKARRRLRRKREERLRKDTLDDMFPNGMDDGFVALHGSD